jgi:hypothetical protein
MSIKQENATVINLGDNDIVTLFAQTISDQAPFKNALMFVQVDETIHAVNQDEILSTVINDLEHRPKVILAFKSAAGINNVIESLIKLQRELFRLEQSGWV